MQLATLDLLASAISLTGLINSAMTEPPLLNVTSLIFGEYSDGIPSDQWVHDFQALESSAWAHALLAIIAFFEGIPQIGRDAVILPDTLEQRKVCSSQKVIKAGDFANISVFGGFPRFQTRSYLGSCQDGILAGVVCHDAAH